MYDTMKDAASARAEVIEKFGVPPDKVIDVQALIGDSTDNVPGVPGIGVKTAAQLINEYGDLETLLARAGEIKQEKRRETLIENAEQARLSRQLVTLDDHVPLDVPLDDLAVHDPDYRRLIAFLKAMEFSHPDAARGRVLRRRRRRDRARRTAQGGGRPPAARSAAKARRRTESRRQRSRVAGAQAKPPRRRATSRRRRSPRRAPKRRATARSTARATRSCARSNGSTPGSRARATPAWSPSTPRPPASIRCRRRCAASRSRCRPTRPATCRSAHRQSGHSGADGLFAGELAADQIPESDALAAQAAARGRRRPQDRAEPQIRLAGVRAARHRDRAASTTPC